MVNSCSGWVTAFASNHSKIGVICSHGRYGSGMFFVDPVPALYATQPETNGRNIQVEELLEKPQHIVASKSKVITFLVGRSVSTALKTSM